MGAASMKEVAGAKRAADSMEGDDFDKEKGSKKIASLDFSKGSKKTVGLGLDEKLVGGKFSQASDLEKGPKKLAGSFGGGKAPVRGDEGAFKGDKGDKKDKE